MPRSLFDNHDEQAMRLALELAASVKGKTGDNPAVGAVVYKGAKILGTGRTQPPGRDHAEKKALKKAGSKARGASLAVTLEPCCHFGRTPPCTRAIINAGIKRVVAAIPDPNPKVNKKGFRELSRAGIRVITGLCSDEALAMNEDFIKFIRTGRPFVALKAAMTLNGLIAANSGDSRWITSKISRIRVHELRTFYDAVVVGMETVRQDDPELTVRHVRGRNPARIILSAGADLPAGSRLIKSAARVRTIIITAKPLSRPRFSRLVEYVLIPARNGRIPIDRLLQKLGSMGFKSLLVEGGSRVFTSFLEQKAVDICYFFVSPKLLTNGIPLLAGQPTRKMASALSFSVEKVDRFGPDYLFRMRPEK